VSLIVKVFFKILVYNDNILMLDFYLFSGLKNKGTKEKDSITDSFEKVDPSETLFLIGSNSIN
jgi:hypothetical protein